MSVGVMDYRPALGGMGVSPAAAAGMGAGGAFAGSMQHPHVHPSPHMAAAIGPAAAMGGIHMHGPLAGLPLSAGATAAAAGGALADAGQAPAVKKSVVPSWLRAEMARRQEEAAKKAAAEGAAGGSSDDEGQHRARQKGTAPGEKQCLAKGWMHACLAGLVLCLHVAPWRWLLTTGQNQQGSWWLP